MPQPIPKCEVDSVLPCDRHVPSGSCRSCARFATRSCASLTACRATFSASFELGDFLSLAGMQCLERDTANPVDGLWRQSRKKRRRGKNGRDEFRVRSMLECEALWLFLIRATRLTLRQVNIVRWRTTHVQSGPSE